MLLCVGFGTDEKLLEGHVVSNSFFVDDTPAITHNLRGDRVNGDNLIGSRVRAKNFLISYFEDAQVRAYIIRSCVRACVRACVRVVRACV